MPIKSLVANIEPVQDLHGYDPPWAAGGGRNLLDWAKVSVSGYAHYGMTFSKGDAEGTIIITGTLTVSSGSVAPIDYADFSLSGKGYVFLTEHISGDSVVVLSGTYGFRTENERAIALSLQGTVGQTYTETIRVSVYAPPAPTEWSPYENLCPISGHTGAEIEQTGKNLLKLAESEMIKSGWNRAFPITVKAGTYIISCQNKFGVGSTYGAKVVFVDESDTSIKDISNSYNLGNSEFVGVATTITAEEARRIKRIRFDLRAGNATYNDIVRGNIQLELGSTASDYEPYTGNQISVDWEDEAGTVYGGTLDLVSGLLTVDRAIVDLGTLAWSYSGTLFMTLAISGIESPPDANTAPDCICEAYKTVKYSVLGASDFSYTIIYKGSSNVGRLWLKDSRFTDVESFKSFVTGKHICYKLANPIIYTLTESEISSIFETLYGTNNIWSSTGDTEVTYPCDTRLFIEGKIAEAVANVMNS
jgi:hypothetical protein